MVQDTRRCLIMSSVSCAQLHADRMKPTRIRMCHSLVMNYGLYKRMEIFVSPQSRARCLICVAAY